MSGTVNPEVRPQAIEERARRVLAALRIANPDADTVRRTVLFINTTGYDVVLSAAQYTNRRSLKDPGLTDPWSYTVSTVNKNAARCGYLYLLFQWVEMALRASLEQTLADAHGSDWFLKPVYLEPNVIQGLPHDPQQSSLKWRYPGGEPIPDFDTPEEFLSRMTFGLLARMVNYGAATAPGATSPRLGPIFYAPNGSRLPPDAVEAYLTYLMRRVRGPVAHNRPPRYTARGHLFLEHEAFDGTVAYVEKILVALRFDLAKALTRTVNAEVEVLNEGIIRNGGQDLRTRDRRQ